MINGIKVTFRHIENLAPRSPGPVARHAHPTGSNPDSASPVARLPVRSWGYPAEGATRASCRSVGSGPSGVYTAQSLIEQQTVPDIEVYVLDRLPCPYGLVRYGVAPDHEKIKSLQNNLRTVLEHDRVRFLGNVEVGRAGLGAEELREIYHAVVYCVGAATDRHLGIPGEELPGSHPATEFVVLVQRASGCGRGPFRPRRPGPPW